MDVLADDNRNFSERNKAPLAFGHLSENLHSSSFPSTAKLFLVRFAKNGQTNTDGVGRTVTLQPNSFEPRVTVTSLFTNFLWRVGLGSHPVEKSVELTSFRWE